MTRPRPAPRRRGPPPVPPGGLARSRRRQTSSRDDSRGRRRLRASARMTSSGPTRSRRGPPARRTARAEDVMRSADSITRWPPRPDGHVRGRALRRVERAGVRDELSRSGLRSLRARLAAGARRGWAEQAAEPIGGRRSRQRGRAGGSLSREVIVCCPRSRPTAMPRTVGAEDPGAGRPRPEPYGGRSSRSSRSRRRGAVDSCCGRHPGLVGRSSGPLRALTCRTTSRRRSRVPRRRQMSRPRYAWERRRRPAPLGEGSGASSASAMQSERWPRRVALWTRRPRPFATLTCRGDCSLTRARKQGRPRRRRVLVVSGDQGDQIRYGSC